MNHKLLRVLLITLMLTFIITRVYATSEYWTDNFTVDTLGTYGDTLSDSSWTPNTDTITGISASIASGYFHVVYNVPANTTAQDIAWERLVSSTTIGVMQTKVQITNLNIATDRFDICRVLDASNGMVFGLCAFGNGNLMLDYYLTNGTEVIEDTLLDFVSGTYHNYTISLYDNSSLIIDQDNSSVPFTTSKIPADIYKWGMWAITVNSTSSLVASVNVDYCDWNSAEPPASMTETVNAFIPMLVSFGMLGICLGYIKDIS